MQPKLGEGAMTFAPDGAIAQQGGLAYGMIVDVQPVQADSSDRALERATHALIRELAKTNPGLESDAGAGTGAAQRAAWAINVPPQRFAGGRRRSRLAGYRVLQPQGLISFFVRCAKGSVSGSYEKTFAAVMDSARLTE